MAYVIAEPCEGTKDTSCTEVCPVDCIELDPANPESPEGLQEKFLLLTGQV